MISAGRSRRVRIARQEMTAGAEPSGRSPSSAMPWRMIFSSDGDTLGSSSGVSRANHHHTPPAITPITALNQKADRHP